MPFTQKHFMQALYDSFPDPVVIVDSRKNILSVNTAASQQFGYASTDIAGLQARVLYASDEDYDQCMRRGANAHANSAFSEGIYRYRRKDETVFSARLRVNEVKGEDGHHHGFIGIIHDISDFVDMDRERRRVSNILDTALQAIPEGFAIFDENDGLLLFNDAYRKVCGPVGPLLHVGMKAEDIMMTLYRAGSYPDAPVGTAQAEAWLENRMHDFRNPSGRPQIFAYGDGQWLQVENLKTKDGHTVLLRIDVTDLKKIELALDRKRLEYYTLVQNIPDFITRISKDLTYIFVNDRYAAFAGHAADDLVGKQFLDFVPERDRERVRSILENLSPDSPSVSREQQRQMPDGSDLWIFWSNIALFDGADLVEYITVGRDITELKQQQARIAQQSAELQRKNEALNQFTGTVSHDLKAPLRHISMFSEMIVEDVADGNLDELPVYARHLRQSAKRMDQLIDSLLDYAQIADQIGNWQTVNMADVISDSISMLGTFVREAGAKFEFDALPLVRGDPELLKRLCQNLIGNALKYRRESVRPVIRIFCESDDGFVRIYFQDNGIGIDPRFARKIFDVFQRLHRDETTYQGTGIGLALAKRIAESHNGSIELDTTFSEGARFVLVLPEMM